MMRPLATVACALAGHRWGVINTARYGYAPRVACRRCGITPESAEAPLTRREAALGLVTLICAAAAAMLAVLTAGGAR